MSTLNSFGPTARTLHWVIAGLIVLQYILAESAEDAPTAMLELALLAQHKSVGITILALALVRLVWRLRVGAPGWPGSMPRWQQRASTISHWSFYGLLLALPLSGWLLSSAAAFSVSWFNLIALPDLVQPSESLEESFELIHETLATALFVLALVHLLAALKHALLDKDDILQRMWSWPAVGIGIVLAVGGAYALMPNRAQTEEAAPTSEDRVDRAFSAADRTPWQIDYAASSIEFTAEQAGAPFTGRWTQWQADVRFQPGSTDSFSAEVLISTGAVETGDADRDQTLAEGSWFDSAAHPTATFRTDTLAVVEGDSYVATGTLTIKSKSSPVKFSFQVQDNDGQIELTGHAQLSRLALGVGTGEWLDTTWVADEVRLDVVLRGSVGR